MCQKKDFMKKSKKTSAATTNVRSVSADIERGDRQRGDAKSGGRIDHNLAIDMQSDSDFSDGPAIAPRRRNKRRRHVVSSPASSQSELEDNAGDPPARAVKPARATTTKRQRGSDAGNVEVRRKYGSVRIENSTRRLSKRLRHKKEQPMMPPQPLQSPGSSLRKIKRVRRHRPAEKHTHTRAENLTRRSRTPASDRRTNLRLRKPASTHKSSGATHKRTILISSDSSDEDGDDDSGTRAQMPRRKKRGRRGRDKQSNFPAEIASFSDEDDSPVLQRRRLSSVRTRARLSNASSASKPTQGRSGADKVTDLTPQAGKRSVARTHSGCEKALKSGRTNGHNAASRQLKPLYRNRKVKANAGLHSDDERFAYPKVQSTMTQMWNEE